MTHYYQYDPQSTIRVEEQVRVAASKAFLRHIPKQGSIVIEGFVETSSLSPQPNQFSCQYFTETLYRDANRVLNFNAQHNGEVLNVSYIAVGTVVLADDMNEIKAHLDSPHGSDYELPTASASIKGGVKVGGGLSMSGDTLNCTVQGSGSCILGTDSIDADGGLWFKSESSGAVLKLKYGDWIYSYKPDYKTYIGDDETGNHLALSGNSADTQYIQLPAAVFNALAGKSKWAFELKFATFDSTDSTNQSPNQLQVKPLLCFPSNGLTEKRTFNLCVENNCLRLRGTYDSSWIITNKVVNDGKIHRVAIANWTTSDGSQQSLYISLDGKQIGGAGLKGFSFTANDASRPLKIAYTGYALSRTIMQLDFYELRVWSKFLEEEELWQPISGYEDDLVAWYVPDNSFTLHDLAHDRDASIFGEPPYIIV